MLQELLLLMFVCVHACACVRAWVRACVCSDSCWWHVCVCVCVCVL